VHDLVVVGPSQLELCFGDLGRLPRPGEELWCRDMTVRPRRSALTAIAASRLGLHTALASPLGDDFPGRYLQSMLSDENVDWLGPLAPGSGMLIDFGLECGSAARVPSPPADQTPSTWSIPAAALVGPMEWLDRLPCVGPRYGIVAHPGEDGPGPCAGPMRALLTTPEAAADLAGTSDLAQAAQTLLSLCETVIVDRGDEGALAYAGDEKIDIPSAPVSRRPMPQARSLFVAAYIWADLNDLPLGERVRWAVLHSARGQTP
jgi:sugar/nucleoside kinase (ribokinase family)